MPGDTKDSDATDKHSDASIKHSDAPSKHSDDSNINKIITSEAIQYYTEESTWQSTTYSISSAATTEGVAMG